MSFPSVKTLQKEFPSFGDNQIAQLRMLFTCYKASFRGLDKVSSNAFYAMMAMHPELAAVSDHIHEKERQMHSQPGCSWLFREACNFVGEFCGVEFLGDNSRNGHSVYYLNTGDTYAATLIFSFRHVFVSSWGDCVERKYVKTSNQF